MQIYPPTYTINTVLISMIVKEVLGVQGLLKSPNNTDIG